MASNQITIERLQLGAHNSNKHDNVVLRDLVKTKLLPEVGGGKINNKMNIVNSLHATLVTNSTVFLDDDGTEIIMNQDFKSNESDPTWRFIKNVVYHQAKPMLKRNNTNNNQEPWFEPISQRTASQPLFPNVQSFWNDNQLLQQNHTIPAAIMCVQMLPQPTLVHYPTMVPYPPQMYQHPSYHPLVHQSTTLPSTSMYHTTQVHGNGQISANWQHDINFAVGNEQVDHGPGYQLEDLDDHESNTTGVIT